MLLRGRAVQRSTIDHMEEAPSRSLGRKLIAGIVLVVVFATRGSGRRIAAGGDAAASRSQAQAILEERFARGEIDEDEFRRRSETLRR